MERDESVKGKISEFYAQLYRLIMFLCKMLLIAELLITSYAVLGRYVGNYIPFIDDPAWSEEIVLTCMIYTAFLSAALAVREESHIRMSSIDVYLPKKVVHILNLFCDILVLAFSLMMLVVGGKYAWSVGMKGYYVSLPKLSKFWLYAPVPLAGLGMVLFEAEVICKHFYQLIGKEK